MFKVYVLFSQKFNKIYIGFTSNIEQRMLSHNELGVKGYTLKYRPWELVYEESFHTKAEAMKREKELKSSRGRNWIREDILKNK
jgi:putative endonuclease